LHRFIQFISYVIIKQKFKDQQKYINPLFSTSTCVCILYIYVVSLFQNENITEITIFTSITVVTNDDYLPNRNIKKSDIVQRERRDPFYRVNV